MEVLLNDAAAAELLAKLRESVGAGNDHALRGAADEVRHASRRRCLATLTRLSGGPPAVYLPQT